MLAGGDPTDMIGLATAATEVGEGAEGRELDPRIAELISVVGTGSEESIPALALALSLATAPGVESGVAVP